MSAKQIKRWWRANKTGRSLREWARMKVAADSMAADALGAWLKRKS